MKSCLIVQFYFFLPIVYTSAFSVNVTDGLTNGTKPSPCSEIPAVANAELSSTTFKSKYAKGDSLAYTCHKGYVGRVILICDGNDWKPSRNAKCSRKQCELPADIPNGQFAIINGTGFVYESIIKYTCEPGYQIATLEDTRTCLAEGWSNRLPVCEELSCSTPVVKDNIVVDGLHDYDTRLTYGHRLIFTCKPTRLKLVGPKEVMCDANGEWNNPFPSCEEPTCTRPVVKNNIIVIGLPDNETLLTYGHQLQFTCKSSLLKLVGPKKVMCDENGEWNNPFPSCEEITCKEGELHTVKIVKGVPRVVPPFKPKHSLSFQCIHAHWTLNGQSLIRCREDGTWSSPYPTCSTDQSCGPPPHIEFADIITSQKFQYSLGERVEYKCKQLHTISVQSFKTCEKGIWTGSPKCIQPCTVSIEEMDVNHITQYYGKKRHMYAPHHDYISFKCQRGRQPISPPSHFRQQCNNGVMHLPICQ